ncbi:MAG: oligosaccharide flippase family protein [Bacteroidetes bacterium]|nr:oligosaccharide flippase family protein [Bacteroidota bacterium]
MSIKQRILGLFEDSAFRAPVLKLLSGTGIAFVIGYLAHIVLLRLFPAEFWGVSDYVIAWVSILAPVSSLRYEDALMLPEDRRQAAHAYLLSVGAVLLFSALALTVLLLSPALMAYFEAKGAGRWMLLLPAALLTNRLAKITELWLSRHDHFGQVSVAQVVQSSSMVGTRIGAGWVGPGPGGLLWGYVVGYALSFVGMSRALVRSLRSALQGGPSWADLRIMASRYRRFPAFTMPAAMISGLITRLPILLIPIWFSMEVTGQFSRGFNMLFVPLSLLAAAVAQVFFVRAVEARRAGGLAAFTANVHARLVLMAFWPSLVLMVAGGDIFETLFGADWRHAASYLLFVAPWILFTVVASPLTRLFDVLERQRLEFGITVVSLAVIAGSLWVGGQSGDMSRLLLYLGIGGGIVRFGQTLLLLHLARCSWRDVIRPYVRYSVLAAPFLALAGWCATLGIPLLTTAVALLGGILFLALSAWRDGLLSSK